MGEDICKSIFDMGFVFRIYKEFLQFNNKKTNTTIQQWAKNMIDISPKKTYQWPKAHKKCSTSLARKKWKIKTTVRQHFAV